jgi:hypothetical protein
MDDAFDTKLKAKSQKQKARKYFMANFMFKNNE